MTAAAPASSGRVSRDALTTFLRKYLIVFIFLGMCVLLAIFTPNNSFLKPQNLINIVRQITVTGLLALGVMLCIIALGIDLSLGSVLGFAAVASASLVQQPGWKEALYPGLQLPMFIAVLAGLGVGLALGGVNGSLIAVFKIPPFIATLGMMTIARGFAYIYSNGRPVSTLNPDFLWIGGGDVLGVPVPVIIFGIAIIAMHMMLNFTRFGRHIYAIGGNEIAARVSGVNIGKTKLGIYAISGLLAGLGGVVITARTQSATPALGMGYELDAIAAAVIGGTSFAGGIGTVWGTVVGALIIGVMRNGMDLLNVSPFYQQVVQGVVIIVAIIIDERKNR
jgi:ribose/xylose/arabinose/galactoside ABC-type transport system permease subunit